MPGPRPLAGSINFLKCVLEIVGREAAQLMNLDMLIITGIQKMGGKLAGVAALAVLEDHGPPRKVRQVSYYSDAYVFLQ